MREGPVGNQPQRERERRPARQRGQCDARRASEHVHAGRHAFARYRRMILIGMCGNGSIALAVAGHNRLCSNGRRRQGDRNQHRQERSDQATHHKLPYAGGMFLFKALHSSLVYPPVPYSIYRAPVWRSHRRLALLLKQSLDHGFHAGSMRFGRGYHQLSAIADARLETDLTITLTDVPSGSVISTPCPRTSPHPTRSPRMARAYFVLSLFAGPLMVGAGKNAGGGSGIRTRRLTWLRQFHRRPPADLVPPDNLRNA